MTTPINYYFIVNWPPSGAQLAVAANSGQDMLRKNLAGTQCIMKLPQGAPYDCENEECPFYGLQAYTHSEIKTVLAGEDWSSGGEI